jgi:hypothetical protein
MGTSMKTFIWPAIVVVGLLGGAWMLRCEVAGVAHGIVVLDRWTGTARVCGMVGNDTLVVPRA